MKKQEFSGSVEIDGKVVGNRVSVSLEPENSLYLNVTEQRIRMFVYPFTPQMLARYGYVVDKGIKRTYSGDDIGFWVYGPIGHPGDGEFENRTITKISMEFLFVFRVKPKEEALLIKVLLKNLLSKHLIRGTLRLSFLCRLMNSINF